MKKEKLGRFIDLLLGSGDLLFSKPKLMLDLDLSEDSFRSSAKRLVAEGKIIRLSHGWYMAIPLEYRVHGAVPPELFIDDYMNALGMKYYICLLSAASFHGATHQAVQRLQVMVERPVRAINTKGARIEFFVNKELKHTKTLELKTDRGPLVISTVESTVVDMMKYIRQSGNLNHIATVLDEIFEKIEVNKLSELLDHAPLLSIQRLGYLFEKVEAIDLSQQLANYLLYQRRPKFYSALNPSSASSDGQRNRKWHLIINEKIELDT